MKIITCASYYGSGSSALTDLVAEYENVKDLSEFEIRFVHQLDGIADLEFHLVENHNRQNSGQALKRFIRLSKFYEGNRISKQYSQFISKSEYHDITTRYVDSLADFKYRGWNFYDLYDRGIKSYYAHQLINHIFSRLRIPSFQILKKEETYCAHPSLEKFLSKTKEYTHEILSSLNSDGKEFLEVDQLVSSSNINRMLRYFEDEIFVVVVDRDPRDVYLLNKYCWNDHVAPRDPDLFCEWFRYTHEAGNGMPLDNPHVKKIQFEDLIYKYNETVHCIEQMTGLTSDKHNRQYKKLNPKRSVVNTRLWEKHADDEGVKIIERKLSEYLYNYAGIDLDNICGVEDANKSTF